MASPLLAAGTAHGPSTFTSLAALHWPNTWVSCVSRSMTLRRRSNRHDIDITTPDRTAKTSRLRSVEEVGPTVSTTSRRQCRTDGRASRHLQLDTPHPLTALAVLTAEEKSISGRSMRRHPRSSPPPGPASRTPRPVERRGPGAGRLPQPRFPDAVRRASWSSRTSRLYRCRTDGEHPPRQARQGLIESPCHRRPPQRSPDAPSRERDGRTPRIRKRTTHQSNRLLPLAMHRTADALPLPRRIVDK